MSTQLDTSTFDGAHWDVPLNSTGHVRTPTLVDSACSLVGYRESMTDSVTRATDAIGSALSRFGVGAVIDSGSPLEAAYRLEGCEPSLMVVRGGPILTDSTPRTEADRFIASKGAAKRAVASLRAEEITILNVRTNSAAFLKDVIAEAGDLRVALRGALSAEDAHAAGARVLTGAHWLTGAPPGADGILASIGELEERAVLEHARRVADQGTAVTTGLLALRRAALPREAMESRYLDELIPIFPHTRHLADMKRVGGYLAGRRQLAAHTGIREPSPVQRRLIGRGWELLLDAVRSFVKAGGRLLPASLGPGFGIVPGFALKEELTLLAHILESATVSLALATGQARSFFGIEAPGELQADVAGSDDRDFILSLVPTSK